MSERYDKNSVPEGGFKPMKDEVWKRRVKKLADLRAEYLKMPVDELVKLVKLVPGNIKTGGSYYTVSLIPVVDCVAGCAKTCARWCYDIQSDIITPGAARLRAINSAMHKIDPHLYWERITDLCKAQFVDHLRINVGGDITPLDVYLIVDMAKKLKGTVIHVFTKNYGAVNTYLFCKKKTAFPKNMKVIFSRWPGMKCENPYGIPECHVDFGDGKCEAPEGSELCGGNCTKCAFEHSGCHGLRKGEAVVIKYHCNIAFRIQK